MTSPFTEPSLPFGERRIYTVSQLSGEVRRLLEENLSLVWVEGEASAVRQPASGHLYLTLKDASSQLRAVIFRNRLRYLPFQPEEGLQVLAFGSLTVYEPRGEYQLIIDHIEPLGAGALAVAFEQLKRKLAAEGLFDPGRKKPLPVLPGQVAVVTSPSGAALWDFLRILGRRFSGLQVQVYPVPVQGQAAPGLIAEALTDLNRLEPRPEVIVLTRGGGSLEDLWAFNDERVARAIAASAVPVVSAVGHELDFTIADFAADLRASTPSAAAELLVRPKAEWLAQVSGLAARLIQSLTGRLSGGRLRVAGLTQRLADPRRGLARRRLDLDDRTERLAQAAARLLESRRTRLDGLSGRLLALSPRLKLAGLKDRRAALGRGLLRAAGGRLEAERSRLARLAERLEALSPLAVLGRGYSLTLDSEGRVVKTAGQVRAGHKVTVRLSQGALGCLVEEVRRQW